MGLFREKEEKGKPAPPLPAGQLTGRFIGTFEGTFEEMVAPTPPPTAAPTPAPTVGPTPAPTVAPPSSQGYLFGTRKEAYVAGIIKPNDTNSSFDSWLMARYDYWCNGEGTNKPVLQYTPTKIGLIPANAYWPKFNSSFACVSEGIGYGMLIAVVMEGYDRDARAKFDGMLSLALAFPCTIPGGVGDVNPHVAPHMMDWRIGNDGSYQGGGWSALDGELDIALACLMADRQWGAGGRYNYKDLAIKRINAMKEWNFDSAGNIILSVNGGARASDYMFGHFRAFKKATGDSFWDRAVERQKYIGQYVLDYYSPDAGLLPDFIVDTSTNSPKPSPGPVGDPGQDATNGKYWWNSCRNPWRFGADYVLSGDPGVKALISPMEDFFMLDSKNVVTNIVSGYDLDGTHLVPINSGGWTDPAFQCPIMVGAMADRKYQDWLDDNWAWVKTNPSTGYYSTEIQILCTMIASGNWWKP